VQTDIPLKRLTAICAADLLPLLGAAGMELVRVGVLELPQTAAVLDTVLWLRDGRGGCICTWWSGRATVTRCSCGD